jgi:hypothetical protein
MFFNAYILQNIKLYFLNKSLSSSLAFFFFFGNKSIIDF